MSTHSINRKPGFTLVELLVVIAIIGILVGLLLPAVQAAREAARRTQCTNNLKQIGLAMHNYHDVYGRLPLQQTCCWGIERIFHSWSVRLLPFMEQESLFDKMEFGQGLGLSAAEIAEKQKPLDSFSCPSDPLAGSVGPGWDDAQTIDLAETNYAVSAGGHPNGGSFSIPGVGGDGFGQYGSPEAAAAVRGVFSRSGFSSKLRDITDGTSNVIMVGEVIGGWCIWQDWGYQSWGTMAHPINHNNVVYQTTPAPSDAGNTITFRSRHPGGAQFGLADGSVQFLSETIDGNTYRNLGDKADGNPIGKY